MQKIGVLISGCGYLDGAEITETVLTLTSLEQLGAKPVLISIDEDQHHVVDHQKQEEVSESRNIMREANRIGRGKCLPINDVKTTELAGLMIPGGFGVAKNFCDFAFKGSAAKVKLSVKDLIEKIHAEGKPIGAICIAPALIALVLGGKNPKLTIGNDEGTAAELNKLGATHENAGAHQAVSDDQLKIVSTPAYMYDDAKRSDIYKGIYACTEKVLAFTN